MLVLYKWQKKHRGEPFCFIPLMQNKNELIEIL